MFLCGQGDAATEIYEELMLTPVHLRCHPEPDSIVMLPLYFTNIGITLEKALIMRRTGQEALAIALLQETWSRMDKFHTNFEDLSHEVQAGRKRKPILVAEENILYSGWNSGSHAHVD